MVNEVENYVATWEGRCYPNGIPDAAPDRLEALELVPSYRRIAQAILNNDLQIIGITPKKSKWYSILKKIEIDAREK